MTVSPNPVSDPEAYRQLLLAALGGDDPAGVQAGTPAELRQLATEAGDLLSTRPEPGEWAVLECIGHFVDAELVVAGRYRWIIAHDEPALAPYDQDRWVDRLRHRDDDVGRLLDTFEALRAADLDLWRRSTDEERARIGHHSERGPESYELTFRMLAGHDRLHLEQARRALDGARRVGVAASSRTQVVATTRTE